jgi:hypothetical protein
MHNENREPIAYTSACSGEAPTARDDGGPAFPCEWDYIRSSRSVANGMALRDYFAAKAMQAYVSRPNYDPGTRNLEDAGGFDPLISQWSYELADAMLAARTQP